MPFDLTNNSTRFLFHLYALLINCIIQKSRVARSALRQITMSRALPPARGAFFQGVLRKRQNVGGMIRGAPAAVERADRRAVGHEQAQFVTRPRPLRRAGVQGRPGPLAQGGAVRPSAAHAVSTWPAAHGWAALGLALGKFLEARPPAGLRSPAAPAAVRDGSELDSACRGRVPLVGRSPSACARLALLLGAWIRWMNCWASAAD